MPNPSNFYKEMIECIAKPADSAALIEEIRIYNHWILVKSKKWALSTNFHGMPGFTENTFPDTYMGNYIGKQTQATALELLASPEFFKRSVGMACLKSILPNPSETMNGNAIDFIEELAPYTPSCFIGHFKKAAKWRDQGYPVSIVELLPQPGDIHWKEADEKLKDAELILMTGLTTINETLEDVILRTPSAKLRVMMGPTVPASPALFNYGINILGITQLKEAELMSHYALLGGSGIVYAPQGALGINNMISDSSAVQERLSAMKR